MGKRVGDQKSRFLSGRGGGSSMESGIRKKKKKKRKQRIKRRPASMDGDAARKGQNRREVVGCTPYIETAHWRAKAKEGLGKMQRCTKQKKKWQEDV